MKYVAAVLTVLVLAIAPTRLFQADLAQAECNPGRGDNGQYYHDGWYRQHTSWIGGASASIQEYSPWVKPGKFAAAWTMLTKSGSGYWSQVGWWEYADDDRRTFVQIGNGGGWHTLWFPKQPYSYTEYQTLYGGPVPNNIWTFKAAGQVIHQEWAYWTPTIGQMYGEINTLANQMPGGYNAPAWFLFSKVKINGVWQSYYGIPTVTGGAGVHFNIWTNGVDMAKIWDMKCPS